MCIVLDALEEWETKEKPLHFTIRKLKYHNFEHPRYLFFQFFREHDTDVGGAVVKILSECQQEVPDFLTDAGAGGMSGGGFGGVDIRSGQDSVSANAADEDDGW